MGMQTPSVDPPDGDTQGVRARECACGVCPAGKVGNRCLRLLEEAWLLTSCWLLVKRCRCPETPVPSLGEPARLGCGSRGTPTPSPVPGLRGLETAGDPPP